jgi:BirA family transcriptional regulator, biotin operon repressor / biotin---[acetyl-CoA-carboxylase] ligase
LDYKVLDAQVKWPNDVLINRRKVAGILAESSWLGSQVQSTILGIGINISSDSVPPPREVIFPATCMESGLDRPINRLDFLAKILHRIIYWRKRLLTADFMNTWNDLLAFQGEWISVDQGNWSFVGKPIKVDENGILHLLTQNGSEVSIAFGDVHLRLLEDKEAPKESKNVR